MFFGDYMSLIIAKPDKINNNNNNNNNVENNEKRKCLNQRIGYKIHTVKGKTQQTNKQNKQTKKVVKMIPWSILAYM